MDEELGGIHYEDPFATPLELKEPVRRLRGRLAAGVTLWTSGSLESPAGLTMSSVLIAEGQPSVILGLMNDTTDLYEAIEDSGAFVVHVLEEADRILADEFAGRRPSPGGPFSRLDVAPSEWGPVLVGRGNRAFCRLIDASAAGYQRLVRGTVERMELDDLERPLVYFRGRYRRLDM